MCRFVETVCIKNGKVENLLFHRARMECTRSVFFPEASEIDWSEALRQWSNECGKRKGRIIYSDNIEEITSESYSMRSVTSLKIVEDNHIDYRFKSIDRSDINRLFSGRKDADDILIVRNGLLTDTSICNIALLCDEVWYTPLVPLLCGTQRTFLLQQGLIHQKNIRINDLNLYTDVMLFNALIPWNTIRLSIDKIRY